MRRRPATVVTLALSTPAPPGDSGADDAPRADSQFDAIFANLGIVQPRPASATPSYSRGSRDSTHQTLQPAAPSISSRYTSQVDESSQPVTVVAAAAAAVALPLPRRNSSGGGDNVNDDDSFASTESGSGGGGAGGAGGGDSEFDHETLEPGRIIRTGISASASAADNTAPTASAGLDWNVGDAAEAVDALEYGDPSMGSNSARLPASARGGKVGGGSFSSMDAVGDSVFAAGTNRGSSVGSASGEVNPSQNTLALPSAHYVSPLHVSPHGGTDVTTVAVSSSGGAGSGSLAAAVSSGRRAGQLRSRSIDIGGGTGSLNNSTPTTVAAGMGAAWTAGDRASQPSNSHAHLTRNDSHESSFQLRGPTSSASGELLETPPLPPYPSMVSAQHPPPPLPAPVVPPNAHVPPTAVSASSTTATVNASHAPTVAVPTSRARPTFADMQYESPADCDCTVEAATPFRSVSGRSRPPSATSPAALSPWIDLGYNPHLTALDTKESQLTPALVQVLSSQAPVLQVSVSNQASAPAAAAVHPGPPPQPVVAAASSASLEAQARGMPNMLTATTPLPQLQPHPRGVDEAPTLPVASAVAELTTHVLPPVLLVHSSSTDPEQQRQHQHFQQSAAMLSCALSDELRELSVARSALRSEQAAASARASALESEGEWLTGHAEELAAQRAALQIERIRLACERSSAVATRADVRRLVATALEGLGDTSESGGPVVAGSTGLLQRAADSLLEAVDSWAAAGSGTPTVAAGPMPQGGHRSEQHRKGGHRCGSYVTSVPAAAAPTLAIALAPTTTRGGGTRQLLDKHEEAMRQYRSSSGQAI